MCLEECQKSILKPEILIFQAIKTLWLPNFKESVNKTYLHYKQKLLLTNFLVGSIFGVKKSIYHRISLFSVSFFCSST